MRLLPVLERLLLVWEHPQLVSELPVWERLAQQAWERWEHLRLAWAQLVSVHLPLLAASAVLVLPFRCQNSR